METVSGNTDLPGYIRENPRGKLQAQEDEHSVQYYDSQHFFVIPPICIFDEFSWDVRDRLGDDEVY